MPTKLPRHTITETPEVKFALDQLRRHRSVERLDLKEVLIAGAERLLRDEPPSGERRAELRAAARWLTSPDPDFARRVAREREAAWRG